MDRKQAKKADALKLLEEIHRKVGPAVEPELSEALGEEDLKADWRASKSGSRRVG